MATWDDVRRIALALPETDEHVSRAVLVRLERTDPAELEELIVEAWLCRAPRRLASEYLDRLG